MKKLLVLVKREFWEHQSLFVRVPAALSIIVCLISVCTLVYSLLHFHDDSAHRMASSFVSGHDVNIAPALYVIASPFVLILWLVVFNYSLSCLFDERKDRSILFWQSLPVNQTLTMLSKVVTALVFAGVCAWFCIIITELFLMVVYSILFALLTDISWWQMWNPWVLFKTWFVMLFDILEQGLWLFPLFSWFMLCSVQANRAPFIRAVLVPLVLMIVEAFFGSANVVWHFITYRISMASSLWEKTIAHASDKLVSQAYLSKIIVPHQVAQPIKMLLIGAVVGLLFLCLAGFFRGYNSPENISSSR